ncbi:hypothetical protein ACJZ2D_006674 [Fusarium nematophilum]
MVPRFRSFSPGRPTTAPNQANSLTSRPRSISRSVRSANSAWSVPEKIRARPERVPQPAAVPPVPPIPSHHRQESSVDSLQDSSSRSVDVLDAQGEIKPASFRSRVVAAGAREFGEDVAERNIGENGLNLNSPAVKAFYRLSGSGRLTIQTSSSGGLSFHDFDSIGYDDEYGLPPIIPSSDLGTIREAYSRPTSPSAWRSLSGPVGKPHGRLDKRPDTSHPSLDPATKATLQNRRRSFNAFAAAPEVEQKKPRPLTLHPSMSSYYRPASPPLLPRTRPKTSEGRGRPRSIGRVEVESATDEPFDAPAPCPTIPGRYKQAARPDTHSQPEMLQPRSDTYQTRPDTHHGWPNHAAHPRDGSQPPSRPSSSSSIDKPYPRTRSGGSSLIRHQRLDNINEHIPIRTSSLTLRSQPCVTPTTMSSGYSSNPFPRSIGQHTPSTSIDASLPPSIKLGHERDQSAGLTSIGNQSSYYTPADDDFSADTLVPSRRELEKDLAHPAVGLDLDCYISDASEDSVDSFVAWKARRLGEEGPLFKEDYGVTGAGLPGLFEPLPVPKAPPVPPSEARSTKGSKTPKSPKSPRRPRSPKSPRRPKSPKSPRRPKSSKSSHRKSRRHHSSRRGRTSALSPPRRSERRRGSVSDEDKSDHSFWEMHSDVSRGPSFVSLADLGIDLRHLGLDLYGLTEDDDAKVDIHTAMKLRKEMKRRKMETQSRRQTPQLYVGKRTEDDGCTADAED